MIATFKRDNSLNKRNYYLIYIVVELTLLVTLFYFKIHWALLLFITPVILIDWWSNARCAKRQKRFVKEISVSKEGIQCFLANDTKEVIPFASCLFSIREKKFEKERTEIEIRKKRLLKSKLIGRLHIKNWKSIFDIKEALITHQIPQIKYRPEGYWSKYGTLTADIAITTSVIAIASLTNEAPELIMPINDLKENLKNPPEHHK